MKTTRETKSFACIAEAVAHYLKQGYHTVVELEEGRVMSKHVDGVKVGEVIINREGFLNVIAEKIEKAVA